MGYYINPTHITKNEWLVQHAYPMNPGGAIPPNHHAVCLIENGRMQALGIAYSPKELKEFERDDGRPKKWYYVADNVLLDIHQGLILS